LSWGKKGMTFMEISDTDKVAVLLDRLEFHTSEIHRREEKESRLFEWSTTLLLAIFAVIISLSDRADPLPYQTTVKAIASFIILIPNVVFILRIRGERRSMYKQAKVIELIETELHLFDENYYVANQALYPLTWKNNLADSMLKRKTPVYYIFILLFLLSVVVITLWLVL
jgi:hypothetical protein